MDQRLQIVIVYLRENFYRDVSLEEMAHSVNLSSSRFRHLFKSEICISPTQYLKSLRMQRAKKLIETTFLNVKQIMDKVGVRDKRHFTEDFKKAYGLTPAQHRARYLHAHYLSENGASRVADSATK